MILRNWLGGAAMALVLASHASSQVCTIGDQENAFPGGSFALWANDFYFEPTSGSSEILGFQCTGTYLPGCNPAPVDNWIVQYYLVTPEGDPGDLLASYSGAQIDAPPPTPIPFPINGVQRLQWTVFHPPLPPMPGGECLYVAINNSACGFSIESSDSFNPEKSHKGTFGFNSIIPLNDLNNLATGFGDLAICPLVSDTLVSDPDPLLCSPPMFDDCNQNEVPDEIDIVEGTSSDFNNNGVPDECERPTDYDGDGIPNDEDNEPFIYNPRQELIPVPPCQQYSYESYPGVEPTPFSQRGSCTIIAPTEHQQMLYFNMTCNGEWVIQNAPVFSDMHYTEVPFTEMTFEFPLPGASNGISYGPCNANYELTPFGLEEAPATPNTTTASIDTDERPIRVGGDGPASRTRTITPPPGSVFTSSRPMIGETITTKTQAGFKVADLDTNEERNSCALNAHGSSFNWLNQVYCLGAGELWEDDPDIWMRLFFNLHGDAEDGTGKQKQLELKKSVAKYFTKADGTRGFPLTIETGGLPFDVDNFTSPDQMFAELCKGQDVEFSYGFYEINDAGTGFIRRGGHSVALTGMTKRVKDGVTTWTMSWTHDTDQDATGGIDTWTKTANNEQLDFDGDGDQDDVWYFDRTATGRFRVIENWYAESPTLAQLRKAYDEKSTELGNCLQAEIDNPAPMTEEGARKLLLLALKLQRIAGPLKVVTDAQNPGNDQISQLRRETAEIMKNGADERVEQLKRLYEQVTGQPLGSTTPDEAAADILDELTGVLGSFASFAATFGADSDFDDVPDASDNAPSTPNADQADRNTNGTPDVLELSASTDCDGDTILDFTSTSTLEGVFYDRFDNLIFDTLVPDRNADGTPDSCQCLGDWNVDGTVDANDYTVWRTQFRNDAPPTADMLLDGQHDIFDELLFLNILQEGCTP
ncbi:MAG: thrombospondin type 3 repeat-containing protein [Planctomycetota bacterium]